MTLGGNQLNYDRETVNGTLKFREKIIKELPSKPTVYTVNLFKMSNLGTPEEKLKHLVEEIEVKQMNEKPNLAAFDQQ